MALLRIPVATKRGTYFDYKGIEVTLSPIRTSPYISDNAFVFDLSWVKDNVVTTIGGILLAAGVDLVTQYKTPIPSLYVLSSNNSKDDILDLDDLNLYIKEVE